MKQTVASAIAGKLIAVENCAKSGNSELEARHLDAIRAYLVSAPCGGGFDSGTEIDLDRSTRDRLVFTTAFHHMNENGYYDGWTNHEVFVKPCLWSGFSIRVTGRNRKEIKDYIHEVFSQWLGEEAN
jgi:hypothetical protein